MFTQRTNKKYMLLLFENMFVYIFISTKEILILYLNTIYIRMYVCTYIKIRLKRVENFKN